MKLKKSVKTAMEMLQVMRKLVCRLQPNEVSRQ